MIWNEHSREMPDGVHSFLSPSTHSWLNYTDEKLMKVYINKLAAQRGTALHELACKLIKMKVTLPPEEETLNMYVNDAIRFKLEPEKKLYYSKFCFGTADAIGVTKDILRIYDLKSGATKVSMSQLEIYTALFFLDYSSYFKPGDLEVELRIYQNCDVLKENPDVDTIVHIMDKIVRFSRFLEELEERYDEHFEA